jgi:hypothetical protein
MKRDKLYHLVAGHLIFGWVWLFFQSNNLIAYIIPLCAVIICAVGKEVVWDKMLGYGEFEWADIVWGITGGVIALLVVKLVIY